MRFDFTKGGEVRMTMNDFVAKIVDDFPDDGKSTRDTPAADVLFQIRAETEPLGESDAKLFHSFTAKLLYLSKRVRGDIALPVAFLTTRIRSPDKDDMNKLTRVIRYLRGTKELGLTLRADASNVAKWFVDASYAVHPDMRSHTGGTMTLGGGSIFNKSTKQKLNGKSSTEAEVIAVDDVVGQILWTQYFLKSQGYNCNDTILYQDNQSAILLETNGKVSSTKRTKHINVRYFFIKDRVDKGEIAIQWCHTDEMLADFFTKPLQGKKFYAMIKQILNL
jgi:hypothetical protein